MPFRYNRRNNSIPFLAEDVSDFPEGNFHHHSAENPSLISEDHHLQICQTLSALEDEEPCVL